MVGAGFLFALKNPASANQVILEKVEEYRRKVKCIKKEEREEMVEMRSS